MNGQCLPLSRLAIVCCMLLCVTVCFAQKVSTILSKDKIVLGEQITLRIQVEGIAEGSVQQDFVFPDSVNHIEILSDSIDTEGSTYIHTLVLTSFDSGYWQFPAFGMIAGSRKLSSEPLYITVLPVDVSNMEDYHDIKDILEIEAANNWWIIAAIVVAGLVSLFAFLWYINRKAIQQQVADPPVDLEKLYNKLLARLGALESSDHIDRTAVISLFKETSGSVRSFTDSATSQQTNHLTTGEYMMRMKGRLPAGETENNYFQFLRLADAVKFAKYHPPAAEIKEIFPILRQVINETFQQNKANT